MSTLIPSVSYTDFKKLKAAQIKELKSIEIVSNGEVLFYAIIPPADGGSTINSVIGTEAEYLAARANTVGGKEIADISV